MAQIKYWNTGKEPCTTLVGTLDSGKEVGYVHDNIYIPVIVIGDKQYDQDDEEDVEKLEALIITSNLRGNHDDAVIIEDTIKQFNKYMENNDE